MSTNHRLSDPILLQRLEGLAALGLGIAVYAWLGQSWWLFALLFLAPDLTMLGYAGSKRLGALTCNLGHAYFMPGLLALASPLLGAWALGLAAIWVAHIGFDRMLGYGFKLDDFRNTHLGRMGKAPKA